MRARPVTIAKDTILWRTFTLLGAGEVLVREADPEDAEGLRRMFARCSQETIYLRFHLPLARVPGQLIAHSSSGASRAVGEP